jgi:hypothetical protein
VYVCIHITMFTITTVIIEISTYIKWSTFDTPTHIIDVNI